MQHLRFHSNLIKSQSVFWPDCQVIWVHIAIWEKYSLRFRLQIPINSPFHLCLLDQFVCLPLLTCQFFFNFLLKWLLFKRSIRQYHFPAKAFLSHLDQNKALYSGLRADLYGLIYMVYMVYLYSLLISHLNTTSSTEIHTRLFFSPSKTQAFTS